MPAYNVFTRRDGAIRFFWSDEIIKMADPGQDPREPSRWTSLWLLRTPPRRGTDWHPDLIYRCAPAGSSSNRRYDDMIASGEDRTLGHMDYRHLGRTGLLVSPLCLGTMNFAADERAGQLRHHGRRPRGGGQLLRPIANGGETEQIVGRWLAQGGGRREKVVSPPRYGTWPVTVRTTPKLSGAAIRDAARPAPPAQTDTSICTRCSSSTGRRRGDLKAMDPLVAQGKVIYVGSSNLCGLAHRGGQRGRSTPRLVRPGVRAEPL